jgi:hypothetical protein
MPEKEKTAQIYLRIPWETHGVLSTLATTYGQSMQDMAQDLLVDALNSMDVPDWYSYYVENRRKLVMGRIFVERVRLCLMEGDEEGVADALSEAESKGMEPNSILSRASDIAQAGYRVSDNVAEAMELIQNHLDENGEAPASTIIDAAAKAGVTRYSLDEARKALKIDSRKRGKRWVWKRKVVEVDDDDTEIP